MMQAQSRRAGRPRSGQARAQAAGGAHLGHVPLALGLGPLVSMGRRVHQGFHAEEALAARPKRSPPLAQMVKAPSSRSIAAFRASRAQCPYT